VAQPRHPVCAACANCSRLFGPAGYGTRTGIIVAPARVTTALSPLLFGLLNVMGTAALLVSGGLSLAALASLALLRVEPPKVIS
jgi:hypothetical protein